MGTKICMFTGHRYIPSSDAVGLPHRLDAVIEQLVSDGYTDFRCGGAQGFDTIAALKVLEKRKKYPNIKLHLFLPCKDQTRGWSDSAKAAYSAVLERADSVEYQSEEYTKWCMHARNRAMVDGSDLCVAYCSSSSGGTAYTLLYAQKNGVEILNLT
jgi:uncharacterized phage-like protein YoqJ